MNFSIATRLSHIVRWGDVRAIKPTSTTRVMQVTLVRFARRSCPQVTSIARGVHVNSFESTWDPLKTFGGCMHITPRILLGTPAALLVIACGATEPNAMHPVNLAAAIAGGATAAGGGTENLSVGDQSGSVSISSAQMILSRIELANQSCAQSSGSVNQSDGDDDSDSTDVDNDDGESSDSTDVDNDDGESSDSTDVDNDDGESSDSTDVDNDDGESSDSTDVDNDDGESSDSTDVDNDDGESSDSTDVDDDDGASGSPRASVCAPLQTGQVVVNLPIDGTTRGMAGGLVPAGTYTRLQARLQTVKVVGVYTDANGTAHQFTLSRRLDVLSAIKLDAPVTVDAATINLILDVGVRSWFKSQSGAVLDPTNVTNQSVVERNIRRSLRARS